jgi:hypothetical protein
MDMDKVRQLYAVRNAIETLAIRAVAFKHTKADIEKVRQLIEVMTLHARASDLRSLSDVELNFHEAVRQIAGNHYVEKIVIRVAAAQMGATQKADQRAHTLHRMLDLLEGAAAPRTRVHDVLSALADRRPSPGRLFRRIDAQSRGAASVRPPRTRRRLLRGICRNYLRRATLQLVILVEPDGSVLGCYRKVHLPGTQEPRENVNFQQLEKALFRI